MPKLAKRCLREYAIACLAISALILSNCRLEAQTGTDSVTFGKLAWTTDSTGPRRFISVHGRRAAIFGYSEDGLEVWTYPVQILSGYAVTFRPQGTTTGIDSQTLLRRVIYSPEAVTRVYAGTDFIVREKLFVPLDEPGVIVRYEVDSARALDIEIRFMPVLDLMWPASIGGQDAVWNSTASAYLLSELTHHFTGSIRSPDIVAHDETPNDRRRVQRLPGLAFTIRAGGEHKTARVVIAGGGAGQDSGATATEFLTDRAESKLERAAVDHYTNLLSQSLQIETPDAETNRALAWTELALDQAWVCNPDLGCGQVAGYGPSRKARRPQYDWFFAGDGMVAIPALLAAGQCARARQELEFILKYQDQKSGMIWHELAQSAASLDWNKYPYMFVHVELTFDFLNTIENYVSVTGDTDFAKAHRQSIQSAYEYCRSLLDPNDGLPRIPPEKEGGREQDALSDELALSASWAEAARAYSHLASSTGDEAAAAEAIAASERAIDSIDKRYWDEQKHFWISGYTRSGAPMIDRSLGPARSIGTSSISQARQESVLDQLASADFQTDWGTRGRASSDRTYDPNSYASGSVWATGTAGMASAFWDDHRPATAFPIWNALVPWSSLDSLGHMHEALAGDYYHEESESVPEQTWSSATFFSATVNGLLGLHVEGASNRVTFAPHLPEHWDAVSVRNLRVSSSKISLSVLKSTNQIRLDLQNEGAPVRMVFNPEIPLGAQLRSVRLGNTSIAAKLEQHSQDAHARMEFTLPHGNAVLTVEYKGGVAVVPTVPQLMVGEPSKAIKITGTTLTARVLTVDFDIVPSQASSLELRTPWKIKDVEGGTLKSISPELYRVAIHPASLPVSTEPDVFQHGKVVVTFAPEKAAR